MPKEKKRGDTVASSRSQKATDENDNNKKGQQAQDNFTKLFENLSNKAGMKIWSEPNADTFNNIFNKKDKKKLN